VKNAENPAVFCAKKRENRVLFLIGRYCKVPAGYMLSTVGGLGSVLGLRVPNLLVRHRDSRFTVQY
jgi:hypothetical protein